MPSSSPSLCASSAHILCVARPAYSALPGTAPRTCSATCSATCNHLARDRRGRRQAPTLLLPLAAATFQMVPPPNSPPAPPPVLSPHHTAGTEGTWLSLGCLLVRIAVPERARSKPALWCFPYGPAPRFTARVVGPSASRAVSRLGRLPSARCDGSPWFPAAGDADAAVDAHGRHVQPHAGAGSVGSSAEPRGRGGRGSREEWSGLRGLRGDIRQGAADGGLGGAGRC